MNSRNDNDSMSSSSHTVNVAHEKALHNADQHQRHEGTVIIDDLEPVHASVCHATQSESHQTLRDYSSAPSSYANLLLQDWLGIVTREEREEYRPPHRTCRGGCGPHGTHPSGPTETSRTSQTKQGSAIRGECVAVARARCSRQ